MSPLDWADAVESLAEWLVHENPLICVEPRSDGMMSFRVRGADSWTDYTLKHSTVIAVFQRMEELAAGERQAA